MTWLKVCVIALVALVVLRSSLLLLKKMSRNSPPTPARNWITVVKMPVMNGTPRHSMFGRIDSGSSLDRERHQPEQEIDHRLVGHVGDAAHHREGDQRAGDVPVEDRPQHEAPPLQRAPAVGDDLEDREQHHAGGDVEIDQQHAEQDHAAGHAEHAGDERGEDDGDADDGERAA